MELAIYCVKDAWLPCRLIVKLSKMINAISMSQVTGVSLNDVLSRGQQIRSLTMMLAYILRRKHIRYYIPSSNNASDSNDTFEGAVVITPLKGFYREPVATLDFASLYPSIMQAYNMCYSTLIPSFADAKQRGLAWSEETHDIKDPADPNYPEVRPIRNFDYPEGGDFKYVTSDRDVCFVTSKTRKGILPEILKTLLHSRKAVKKLMKNTPENDIQHGVYNGRQLALKVCANSIYGFTGAGKGYLGEKRIASSVTKIGRGMANKSKWMCESTYKEHNVKCVYGDSVSGETPLLVLRNDKIQVICIQDLDLSMPTFTWTEQGWTRVTNIIKHKLDPTKKMLRVFTHTGMVDCTSDHSLVNSDGNAMFPKDVLVGSTRLMQSFPDLDPLNNPGDTMQFEEQLDAHWAYIVRHSNGIHSRVSVNANGQYCLSSSTPDKFDNVVIGMEERPYEEYVYDLTTANHHFQAGIGNIIVHNTDSVFIHLPRSLCSGSDEEAIIKRACELGVEMGEMCTKTFLPPNDLEFEKIYLRLLLKGKKRYFGWKIEPGCKRKLDVKGFECIRRDFAPILAKTQKRVAELISKEDKMQDAINLTRKVVLDLLYNRVPIEGYIMSKKLTKPPEQYANPAAHVALALRLKQKYGEEHAPKAGERVNFIIGTPPYRGAKTSECAVSVEAVRSGAAAADNIWYLENQFKKPMMRIFELLMDNPEDIFRRPGMSRPISQAGMGKFVQRTARQKLNTGEAKQIVRVTKTKKTNQKSLKEYFFQ